MTPSTESNRYQRVATAVLSLARSEERESFREWLLQSEDRYISVAEDLEILLSRWEREWWSRYEMDEGL